MRRVDKGTEAPLFVPDYVADSVLDIDFGLLKKAGVTHLAFDADSTLVNYRHKRLDPKTQAFLTKQLADFEDVCIASNRVTNDLHHIAEAINAKIIRATITTRKPSSKFFRRVIDMFGVKPVVIAMVGDKLMADIYGGNKAGMVTVWVKTNGRDSIFDRILQTRRVEKWLTRKHI